MSRLFMFLLVAVFSLGLMACGGEKKVEQKEEVKTEAAQPDTTKADTAMTQKDTTQAETPQQ